MPITTPQNDGFVGFTFGKQAIYDKKANKDSSTIYFCYDSHRLFLGTTEYTRPVYIGQPENEVTPNSICIADNNNGVKEIRYTQDGKVWSSVALFPPKLEGIELVGNKEEEIVAKVGEEFNVPQLTFNDGYISSAKNTKIKLPDIKYQIIDGNDGLLDFGDRA